MQPGQNSSGNSSYNGSSVSSSGAAYSDNQIKNLRRRMEILMVETPELDFATKQSLASSAMPDADLISTARSSVSFGARQITVKELSTKSDKEQRAAWEKMSESRRQFLVDAGYRVPEKKKAQWVSWWEYPQHYTAEYVAKAWDVTGADSMWKKTAGKPAGWFVKNVVSPVFGAVANFSDDVAARPTRAAVDSTGQMQLARWQIGLQKARSEYQKQYGDLNDDEWGYILWKYTNDNLGELNFLGTSDTNVNMTAQMARLHPMFGTPLAQLDLASQIPGLDFLGNLPLIQEAVIKPRKVNPYKAPVSGVGVDDATYEKFSRLADTIQEMEPYDTKSVIDIWNRVDNGLATPDNQLKVLKENFNNDFNAFDIAMWESEGKSLEQYLTKVEKLDPQTTEFETRFADLQTNVLSKNDYKTGLGLLKADNAKISIGRIVSRGLGVQNVPYLNDIVSGTVDGLNVVIMDPLNLLGPAFKWTRFARFGIRASEIGLAAAADDAFDVIKTVDGLGFVAAKEGDEVVGQVIKVVSDPKDIDNWNRSSKLLEATPEFTGRLDEAGFDFTNGFKLIDEEGLPTPQLLDNWDELNRIAQETSDDLTRQIMGRTGNTPEAVADLVQRRALVANQADFAGAIPKGVEADELIGIYNRIEAVDHLQAILRRTSRPVIDIKTGNKLFNWFANSSLAGTRRWMDRTVQAFVDLENGVDGALTKLMVDLNGAKIIAPLKQYHDLLKARGLGGIKSRQDIWGWLETSALYHMNIGDFTGQIARGFGSGVALPNKWRVFGRLTDDVPMLVNREALGMLPRLTKFAMRRRRLWNKTERAMFAAFAKKENESLLRKLGMSVPRSTAKFLFSLSHQVPANSWLHLAGDNSVAEFEKLLNYGFFAGVPREVLDDFLERFVRGESVGTRVVSDMTRTEINQRFDVATRSALSDISMVDRWGDEMLDTESFAKLKTLLDEHPIIQTIREELGIDDPFTYRSGNATSWINNERPDFVEAAFEYGWSDEVLERWDEVAQILDRSSFKSPLDIQKSKAEKIAAKLDSYTTQNYKDIFDDSDLFADFYNDLQIVANDMGLGSDEIIEYLENLHKHLRKDSDFIAVVPFSNKLLPDESAWVILNEEAFSDRIRRFVADSYNAADAIEYENITDMLTSVFKSYRRESIFNSSVASRIKVEQQFLHELFNQAGVYSSDAGRTWADDFFGHLERFRYAPNDQDVFALKTLSGELANMRVAVLPFSQRSRVLAIPPFEKFVEKMNQIGLTGRFTRRLNRSFLDSAMTQIWKPLTLMRLGFIPRAAGEEYIAFYARRGIYAPMASLASNIAPDRRGAILGTLNHLGSLPSRVFRRVAGKGWINEFAQVSDVLKYANQADYMAARAAQNGITFRGALKGRSELGDAIFDDLISLPNQGTLSNLEALKAVIPADKIAKATRHMNSIINNTFDYLRIASEYHTAKIAASIKSLNFKLMPQNLKRAILVEFAGTGKAEFAEQLGLIDHYAVTAALRADADKLMRVAYMQQAFADAQSGVGGMIADPNITDQVATQTIRIKNSAFDKSDDIVVEVRADRGWVSVDPTKLENDGLYLAAGQQGSLIDNDPIAMEVIRVLANRVHERRLALNYQHLAGTQWDAPLMEVIEGPKTIDEIAEFFNAIDGGSDYVREFADVVANDPVNQITEFVLPTVNARTSLDMPPFSLQNLQARAVIAHHFSQLTPNKLAQLKSEIIDNVMNERFGQLRFDLQYALDADPSNELIAKRLAQMEDGSWVDDPYFETYLSDKNKVESFIDQLENSNSFDDELEKVFYDPNNPYSKSKDWADDDLIENHRKALPHIFADFGADAIELPNPVQELIARDDVTDAVHSVDELFALEQQRTRNSDLFYDPSELTNEERILANAEQSSGVNASGREAEIADDFFNSRLFRVHNSYDQFYVDADGALHLRANVSGRNKGKVVSTLSPQTDNVALGETPLGTWYDNWTQSGSESSASIVSIDKEYAKTISGGAGADDPNAPFEIELLVDDSGEVIIPKGSWEIYYGSSEPFTGPYTQSMSDLQGSKFSRTALIDELEKIANGTLQQEDSLYWWKVLNPEMQNFIDVARLRGSIKPTPTPIAQQQLNVEQTLQQFELVRQSVQTLDRADRQLLQAAFQADEIAAGKSAIDSVLNQIDTKKLHPSIQHQLDYLAEGSNYARAVKRAVELADDGDSSMLEILQVMSASNRDVAQILFSERPLQFADEAADIVDAETAVLRALQNPDYAPIVDDMFLANFDEATGLGPSMGVNEFERPVYSVMVDTYTAKYIERILGSIGHTAEDMRGMDTLINLLRANGATDDDLELVQRLIFGIDPVRVAGQVRASNPLYRSTLVPISSTTFTNVQDAQRLAELLTGLSPGAGDYRPYLGFTARPNSETFAKVGHATVPADKGRVLNAVYSDDARSLVFDPNYQYHIDRMSPLAEKENLIYYGADGKVSPAGEIAVEGVPRETILREAARRITSSVLDFVQSREGRYLHELIGPMDRKTWGVDAMYHVPVSELPTRIIYRTPYVAPQTSRWADFVRRNFELINKAIFSISRSPQFTLGLSEGLAFAREITDVWRNSELDDLFETIMREVNNVGDDALEGVYAANSKRELQNAWAMIGEAANSELNDGAELMDELVGLAADGRLHPDSALLDLTNEQADSVLEWIRLDSHLEKLEMQRGFERAVAETVPYIDDHNIRSFFQVYAKNIFPFEFAQEAFLKRWARTVIYSPEAFRRMQLLVHTLQSSGFAQEDPTSGKLVFVFPWTEALEDLVISNPASKVIFGDAAQIPVANPLTGNLENVLPGIPSDFQNLPQASPIAMMPLTAIAAKFPEFKPFVSTLSGGRPIDTSGVIPTAETVLSQWVPANYLRMVSAGLGIAAERIFDVNLTDTAMFGFTGTELHQATMSAMAQLEAESIRLRSELETMEDEDEIAALVEKINIMSLPDNATSVQIEQHADMVMQWARMNMMFRAVVGFVAPTAPRNAFKDFELSKEYGELLKYMSPEEALAAFLTEHPNAQPWTIFQTEKTTAAELSPTQRTLDWMNDNREFLNTYEFAAPWFMPQAKDSDEGSMQAHLDMVAAGLKTYKLPTEWYSDLKFTSAANIYFPSLTRKELALENTTNAADRKKIENEWTMWADQFKTQHPIFADVLASSVDSKAIQTLNQLNDLLLLDDSELPKTEHIGEMREMVQSWKRYEASMNRIKGLSSKDVRMERENLRNSFLSWGEMFTVQYPKVRSLWNSLVLPAADLKSEARILQGKD